MKTGSVVVLGLALAGSAWAEAFRFDMGGETTPLAAGYVRVTPATTLDKSPDFGWKTPPARVLDRTGPMNPYYASADTSPEYALYGDGVISIGENSFEFKVPAGWYKVTAVIGDLSPGESRPGNSLWANDALVAKDLTTDATVDAVTFAVEARDGWVRLRFRADSDQRYATVEAVTAEPLAAGAEFKTEITTFPQTRPAAQDYQRNWHRHESLLVADWEKAKAELKAEGIDVPAPTSTGTAARSFAMTGWPNLSRLDKLAGGLDLAASCRMLREMGIDIFLNADAASARELAKHGLGFALHGGGESMYGRAPEGCAFNVLRNAKGEERTQPLVFSNADPQGAAAFDQHYQRTQGSFAKGASLFLIDEPRGQWYAGGWMGDYSAANRAAFQAWARERGWKELAEKPLPTPGRNMDFHRFYLYRLESAAVWSKLATSGTPFAGVPVMPGNGDVGPEQMNHNSYWPPAFARRGLLAATWTYLHPASAKMHAETLQIAREYGGKTGAVGPLLVYGRETPVTCLPILTAVASVMSDYVLAWGASRVFEGSERPAWMKSAFLAARLTHATAGLERTPACAVWLPESIVYNDLVELNTAEAAHWKKLWQTLADANLDYGVTNLIELPAKTVLVYTCVRPVLSEEEFSRLREFLAKGGRLVAAFPGEPEYPDGRKIEGWQSLPADRVIRAELAPAALAAALASAGAPQRWAPADPAVTAYHYRRGGKHVILLNHTGVDKPAPVVLPGPMTDCFTGRRLAENEKLVIPPGRYALLEE